MKERLNQAIKLHQQGQIDQARVIYEEVLAKQPNNSNALQLMGLIYNHLGDYARAIESIDKAISIHGRVASYYHNGAGVYRKIGDHAKAREYFHKAIALKADYGEAYQGLVELQRYKAPDKTLRKIEAQLKTGLEDKLASYFHFAAGKIYDDIGEYDRAFKHFLQANRKSGRQCDMATYARRARDIVYVYSHRYLKHRAQWGLDDGSPIFIVGMPRCGSTLVEQVLASHSQVFGAGELPDIHSITGSMAERVQPRSEYPNFMVAIGKEVLQGYGKSYLQRIREVAKGQPYSYSVDKQLMNFFYLGLILEMFPRAKIVHVRRDPRDTCLSCFFHHFSDGVPYSFDLLNLGLFYTIYERVMEHWRDHLQGRMLEIRYEDFVANQEENTRKLLDYCQLPWEDDCLRFDKTKRAVSTASFWQVRQPVYQRAVGRWQNYQEQLRPLLNTLPLDVD